MKTSLAKNLAAVVAFFLVLSLFSGFNGAFDKNQEVSITDLVSKIKNREVEKITVEGSVINITLRNKKELMSRKEPEAGFSEMFKNYGVTPEELQAASVEIKDPSGLGFWFKILLPILLPFILIVILFLFISKQAQKGAMQAFSFGKSSARIAGKNEKITFDDIAGLYEAKEELKEIVGFLMSPKKYLEIGAMIPRGVLLIGRPGTGKCVVGNTMIQTSKGLVAIDDVPKYFSVNSDNTVDGLNIVTLDSKSGSLKSSTASHWYSLGEQDTISIRTEAGLSIEGTPEHPIITVDQESGHFIFKQLSDVSKEDWCVVGSSMNFFGSYTKIPSPEVAYLLGVLTGDGCLTIKDRIFFSTADQEILSRVQNISKNVFNKEFSKSSSSSYDYHLCSVEVKASLISWGLTETYARHKRIPEWVRFAPQEYVRQFLQGLFDTDGSVEKPGSVSFSSASEDLVREVQLMLLNFGIVVRSYQRTKKYNNQLQYYIVIYGDFVSQFQSEIGFSVNRKRMRLEAVCAKQRNTNINVIPFQNMLIENVWKEMVTTTAETLNRDFYRQTLYKNTKRYIAQERMPSQQGMSTFLEGVLKFSPGINIMPEVAHLKNISSGKFFFTKINSIEKGRAQVYDLTVPVTHNFLANGFINHNTLIARAVAGEANVPFYHISASEFVEMFVGVGASRVRDLFQTAKKNSPSILFIDEIDAIGRHRGSGVGGGHDEREQTLNQILVEMDGFERNTGVIVIAATNRPDVLDSALLRPGRFDRRITLDEPDIKCREEVLKLHLKNKKVNTHINVRKIAERTPGFSGADLANLVNEGALLAARRDKLEVGQEELLESIEKVLLGPERKSHILSVKEKEIVSYHEAGHALVAAFCSNTDPVHKISIISRGMAGGYTLKLPTEDRRLHNYNYFLDELAVLLGGYSAEKTVFNEVTTGASDDLMKASDLARRLVTDYGMSRLGPVTFDKYDSGPMGGSRNFSEKSAELIDKEIKFLVDEAYKQAKNIIIKKRLKLNLIAKRLIEKEVIEKEEFEKIIKSK